MERAAGEKEADTHIQHTGPPTTSPPPSRFHVYFPPQKITLKLRVRIFRNAFFEIIQTFLEIVHLVHVERAVGVWWATSVWQLSPSP